ncbi:MAG TPA: glycosyltransferase [Anaerolineales bacterium]|nr:glycosyltransferase [Anaerolineales bacterium]
MVFAKVALDARVARQIEYARKNYEVDVIGHGDWQAPAGVRYHAVPQTIRKASLFSLALLLAGNVAPAVWEYHHWRRKEYMYALEILRNESYDLIHANDLSALPVASKAVDGRETQLLFDAHEFYFEQGENPQMIRIRKPHLKYLFNTYRRNIDRMVTVSEGIAALYQNQFNMASELILNAPFYVEHPYHPVDPARIQLVNQGAAIPGRRIEDLITMMPYLHERFHLNLLLKPSNKDYYEFLRKKAQEMGPDRVTIHDQVSPDTITDAINKFDIGIHLLDADNLNHYYALPKKLFDYIMAGLASVITPLPEMRKIVEKWQVGIVSPDHSWQSMVKALNSLTDEQINVFKCNSLELAKTLNANNEMDKLMNIYASMLGE